MVHRQKAKCRGPGAGSRELRPRSGEQRAKSEERRAKSQKRRALCSKLYALSSTLYALCLMALIWAALLTSSEVRADLGSPSQASESPLESPKTAATSAKKAEKVYKLPPPGEDPRQSYLLAGESLFRSRDLGSPSARKEKLKKAREAFEKVLELDSQVPQAHYFLGLIEYEEGNTEKAKTRFQIAHECIESSNLGSPSARKSESWDDLNDKQVQLEFPDEYRARIYYKDGWYVTSKKRSISPWGDGSIDQKTDRPIDLLILDVGSTYRIELESKLKELWVRRFAIGFIVTLSFFLAR